MGARTCGGSSRPDAGGWTTGVAAAWATQTLKRSCEDSALRSDGTQFVVKAPRQRVLRQARRTSRCRCTQSTLHLLHTITLIIHHHPLHQPKPTMYSAGAMYSTLPLHSSGRSAWSMRRPAASSVQKYSTGTSFTMAHTLQE